MGMAGDVGCEVSQLLFLLQLLLVLRLELDALAVLDLYFPFIGLDVFGLRGDFRFKSLILLLQCSQDGVD